MKKALSILKFLAVLYLFFLCIELMGGSFKLLGKDDTIGGRQAVACALASRYFRRVAGHLKNVASAAVNPYSHIGYIQTKEAEFRDD